MPSPIGLLLELLRVLLNAYNQREMPDMETALLARGFVLLVAELNNSGVLGESEETREIRAIAQEYSARTRAQAAAPFHTTKRGEIALARADELDAEEKL